MYRREGSIVASDDAIRAYIRARREKMEMSQGALAKAIYMPFPTYRDWESAQTQEMKARPFACAAAVLSIPVQHIQALGDPNADPIKMKELADDVLLTPRSPDPDLDAAIIETHNRRRGDGQAEQRLRVAQMAEQLINHPELLAEWLHYGEFLLRKREGRSP